MNVITVIPLSRGILRDHLTYFTGKPVRPGSLVTVPVRKKMITALVIRVEDARSIKSKLRSADFTIKKVEDITAKDFFDPALISAAEEAAEYFATTPGSILESVVPKAILENADELKSPQRAFEGDLHPDLQNEEYIFQTDDDERMATYKSFIRQTFARNQSVFFCLPTIQNIEQVYQRLEKGIGAYTYVLHSKLTKKQLIETWNAILLSKRPVLIIATGRFLSIPRHDIGAIVLDSENTGAYKRPARPYIDYRTFTQIYAKQTGTRLIYGDILLRSETMKRYEDKSLIEFAPIKVRALSTADRSIVDMREYNKQSDEKEFTIISDELAALVERTSTHNEHLFLLATKKGLHPITVCADCGQVVTCTECTAPTTLHKKPGGNIFACHKCGQRRDAKEHCTNCDSWRLTPLGIGTELAEEKLKEKFDIKKLIRFDKESVTTHKKALALIDTFYNTPGAVLIGTEMAIPYLHSKVDNIGVLSVDALFSLPSFRINERIFRQLMQLYTKASKNYLIQTRNKDEAVFDHCMQGNLMDFHRVEMEARKEFGYPPFKTFIKITREGTKAAVQKDMADLDKRLENYDSLSFPAFTQEVRGKFRMHTLIKMKAGAWPDLELLDILRSLPPTFAINVDPDDLL